MSLAAVSRLCLWAGIVVLAALVAPDVTPLDPSVQPTLDALVLGVLSGAALFGVLTRRRVTVATVAALPQRRLLARAFVLCAKSAQEEALWRALLFGSLVGPLGRIGALATSSVLFAGAHLGRAGRHAVAHLVTGATFGLTYLTTGRLHAAIAAHGTYNVLVGVTALADEGGPARAKGPDSGAHVRRPGRPTCDRSLGEPVALLDRVSKRFGHVQALDDVTLDLRAGEIVALLGPNAAGKSTAVALLLGLRRPDSGHAELFGHDPREATARRSVGAVLQEVGFPPGLRVGEAAELVRAHLPRATSRDPLERLGVAHLAARDAGGLSGGQRRRLAVALALCGDPRALFLDEPTAGMDALARRTLLRDVASFARRGGAVLLTTQRLDEAQEIATRVVLLRAGRVVTEGTVDELRRRAGLTRVTFRTGAPPPRLAGAETIATDGDRHVVLAANAEAFVAALVGSGITYRELEVTRTSLEDAFVTLTDGAGE